MTQTETPAPFDLAQAVYAAGRSWVTEQVRSGQEFNIHDGAWEILANAPREALEAMAFAALRHKMVQRCGGKTKDGLGGAVNDEDRGYHPLAANPAVWVEDEELGEKLVAKQEGVFIGWEHADHDARLLSEQRRRRLGHGSIREANNIAMADERIRAAIVDKAETIAIEA
jgi:hypothetical protein